MDQDVTANRTMLGAARISRPPRAGEYDCYGYEAAARLSASLVEAARHSREGKYLALHVGLLHARMADDLERSIEQGWRPTPARPERPAAAAAAR